MDYPVIFERNEDDGWTVTCPILPGCISEGRTKEEAEQNIKDAIQLYLRAVKKEMQIIKQHGARITKVAIGV
ncbi:MAG: type II toxin-antitoxin system HicB family antitoxin [Candidatus Firestonebacteria bacterium]